MKITKVTSHVLQHDLGEELGYSQQYYAKRTAHLVEVETDAGITGWGECFGPGNVALANKTYNLMRDNGQKGMPIQALSGIDIAGKVAGLPLYELIGGKCRDRLNVYGYGMMLRKAPDLAGAFEAEAARIKEAGFRATKMKVGLGPREDVKLVEAVRRGVGDGFRFMVNANHCYTTSDAFYVGRALEELDVYWFEEPVAPEDHAGYAELRAGLKVNISGGEAEFTRWGWRPLLEARCVDIAQPEVCGLGGISEYLKVLALCQAHFTPVINHVWGSAVAVATNMHLITAMPDLPGGLHQAQPMLELDTTLNKFRDEMLTEPLNIQGQVAQNEGTVGLPSGPGLGVEIDRSFLQAYKIA